MFTIAFCSHQCGLFSFESLLHFAFVMGNTVPSQYEDSTLWTTLSKHARKEVLKQNNQNRRIEKHTIRNVSMEEVKNQEPIFDWRTKTIMKGSIEILQMRHIETEDAINCQFDLCCPSRGQGQLVVYTEHLTKLYENNDRAELKLVQQFNIFRDIVDSIETLAHKFGYFSINKEMVGFNSKRIGKAWINQNFACNCIQLRQRIENEEDQAKWENQIITDLVSICLLYSSRKNSSNHTHNHIKFYAAVEQIRNYQLFTFASLRNHFKRFLYSIKKSEIYQSTQEMSQMTNKCKESMILCSNLHSEVLSYPNPTGENQKQSPQIVIGNCVPVFFAKSRQPIAQKEKLSLHQQISKSYEFLPDADIKKKGIPEHKNDKNTEQPLNYVHISRQTKSIIIPSQQSVNLAKFNSGPVTINKHSAQAPVLYNREIKEIKSSKICMIDSMIIMEQQAELGEGSFSSNGKNNIILQESVILRR